MPLPRESMLYYLQPQPWPFANFRSHDIYRTNVNNMHSISCVVWQIIEQILMIVTSHTSLYCRHCLPLVVASHLTPRRMGMEEEKLLLLLQLRLKALLEGALLL